MCIEEEKWNMAVFSREEVELVHVLERVGEYLWCDIPPLLHFANIGIFFPPNSHSGPPGKYFTFPQFFESLISSSLNSSPSMANSSNPLSTARSG